MQNRVALPLRPGIAMKTHPNTACTSGRLPRANVLGAVVLAAGLLMGIVPEAQSQTIFTDRAAYNAALAAAGLSSTLEGYETYPNDAQAGPRTITLGYFRVSYNDADSVSEFGVTDTPPAGGSGIGPTAGSKYLYAAYPTPSAPSGTVDFLFGAPIQAFGTDVKDLENANLTYDTSSGASGVAAFAGADGNVQFFGILSNTPFTSIGFTAPGAGTGDGVVFDQTTFSSTPEPSAALFGVIGVLGIASYRIRRRRPQRVKSRLGRAQTP